MNFGNLWDLAILSPMINVLIVMSKYLFNNFGLAIIALTIIIRLATLPLNVKQASATKAMQQLQPKLAELQKKYARVDRAKLAQEQMKLYKESGVSPAGCMLPMLIQMPIWIALFQSIVRVLAVVPEDFLSLSKHLYSSWPMVFSAVPLGNQFMWLDLAVPDPVLILPLLVGGTMWVQQKMVTPAVVDPRQAAQNQMMLWMMPLMFAFLTLQFPSGLALYWVVSNVISVVIQYKVSGWGGLRPPTRTTGKKQFQLASKTETPEESQEAKTEPTASSTLGIELPKKRGLLGFQPWRDRGQKKKR